jgi:branched-chain amino acid transport system substrate-binding protein
MHAVTTTRRGAIVSAVATGLLLCALATPEAALAAAACTAPIEVGLTTALTGPLALLGVQARNGVAFAIERISSRRSAAIARPFATRCCR